MAKAVVIGSGFGGLSSALYLARAGHQVTVVEKNEQLGGRASVLTKEGFRRDMGPSRYLMPDLFEQFFADFDEDIGDHLTLQKLAPSYKIYFKDTDKAVRIYDQIENNRETFESLEPGSTDMLYTYLEKAKYQYEIAMAEFVPKNYDSLLDFFTWKMLTQGTKLHVFSKMHSYVKRYFKTDEMQKIMEYPLVFLGTAPKDAPALYNIMSRVDFGMGVFYPQGGIRAVIDAIVALAEDYQIEFRRGAEVDQILTTGNLSRGVRLRSGEEIQSEFVVSNADMRWTETHLLEKGDQTYPQPYRDKKLLAPSAFILYLGVEGKVNGLDHHTLIFSRDRDKNFSQIFRHKLPPSDPSLYVCCPSKTDSSTAPEGKENLFVLVPFPPGVYLTGQEQQAYRDKVIHLIEHTIGERFADRIIVEEWFGAEQFSARYNAFQGTALGLAHTLWQSAVFRPNNVSKKLSNLFYAGGYTNPGIGMPMCLISGKLAAERVSDYLDSKR